MDIESSPDGMPVAEPTSEASAIVPYHTDPSFFAENRGDLLMPHWSVLLAPSLAPLGSLTTFSPFEMVAPEDEAESRTAIEWTEVNPAPFEPRLLS